LTIGRLAVMINPTSGNRLLTPPFSLSFLYTIQESGLSGRTARFPAFLGGVPALAGGFWGVSNGLLLFPLAYLGSWGALPNLAFGVAATVKADTQARPCKGFC